VVRTKIDDSEVTADNIRYYAGPEVAPYQNPTELGFWVNEYENENYIFRDYYDPEWPPHRKFYENNQAQTIPLSNWDTEKFGELNYTWRVIHDHRRTSLSVRYNDIVDTTDSWGNNWAVELTPPTNWQHPDSIPYMRLLTFSEVNNLKNGIFMQGKSSPDSVNAHKLMFAHNWIFPEFSIADWAVSHIGVPYTSGGAYYKIPYIKNDCSGFVTSARIQELDECGPGFLMVGWIPSCDYEDGDFWVPGHTVDFTEHVDDLCEEPNAPWGWQGLLLFIRRHGETMECPDSPSKHILIIYYMSYDCDNNRVRRCYVVHAPGGYSPDYGRVRYDNAVSQYPPYDPVNNPQGWDWTFIKFR
jgi:surface protein